MTKDDLCRTCALHATNLVPLSSQSDKYAKSLLDILQELTKLDSCIDTKDEMPQKICQVCRSCLEDAYEFVVKAHLAHEELILRLHNGSQIQCLEEGPIDFIHNIKVEVDIQEECLMTPIKSMSTDGDVSDDVEADIKEDEEELTPLLTRQVKRKFKKNANPKDKVCNDVTPKRGRGRPPTSVRLSQSKLRSKHTCDVCGKTFAWLRGLQRHARMHFEEPSFVCEHCGKTFLRKDKYMLHMRSHTKQDEKHPALQLSKHWRFAERLYSSGRLKRIECKLCGFKCQRLQELRSHMPSHADIETLHDFTSDNDVIKVHFAGDDQMQLSEIKEKVCADITAQQWDKYYTVVNAHGYELCLSDSDEELSSGEAKYNCPPCQMAFTRKHRLIRHTLEEHTQEKSAPALNCKECQIGFVCEKLYEQHQRTQCENKLKRYHCVHCPGKFMWLENLQFHACSQMKEEHRHRIHCQCCLCDDRFQSLSELRAHMSLHRDGRSGIDPGYNATFFKCYFPNGVDCSASDVSESIAADYAAHAYAKYYIAHNDSGSELDLYDSDDSQSDNDNDGFEKEQVLALHTCAVCGETTTRLRKLMKHQENVHAEQESLPYTCNDCNVNFVSDGLLQQHRRRICAKQHVKYLCEQCPARFIWQVNYERHMAKRHPTVKKRRGRPRSVPLGSRLQCDECEKVFVWVKDLNRHKRLHQPHTALFECTFCDRKFHRKDGLKSHQRVHADQHCVAGKHSAVVKREAAELERMPVVLTQLCKPHGCKQIQCMICLSSHTKISDLRTHLKSHNRGLKFSSDRSAPPAVSEISRTLYPEIEQAMTKQGLIKRIMDDVGKGLDLDRFYSITNEAGCELSLDSSETESDSDSEHNHSHSKRLYSCELCRVVLPRKYELYAHQLELHQWQEASSVCTYCNARFVSDKLLEHHLRTLCGNPQKRFLCRKCPLRFRWKENLKLHMNVAHQECRDEGATKQPDGDGEESKILECSECKLTFKMKKDLTRHALSHVKESSIFRCRWCARRFYRLNNLLQHIARHGISADQLPYAEALINANRNPNGRKIVICKVCDQRFDTIAALRNHLLKAQAGTHHDSNSMLNYSITNQLGYELHLDDSETDEDPEEEGRQGASRYTCNMCQLRCNRKYELFQHQQSMHRLERITTSCEHCIFKCVCPSLIEHHQRMQCTNTEKQFKCTKCGYRFMWESNLLLHMELQHDSNVESAIMTIEEPPKAEGDDTQIFQCVSCPRKYNRKDRLTAHVKKFHTPGAVVIPKLIEPKEPLEKRFLCAFCGKAVSSSSNLIIHMRRHTGEKPFKCDHCDMAFPRSSDLQCHRRTHTGERPHVCTVCQRGFARSYKLQQHMRIHNGERPYKCTYCEKSFTQSNDLTLHIRRHTGERPYQCGICGERFIQGTALKNHRIQQSHFEEDKEPPRRTILTQFGPQ